MTLPRIRFIVDSSPTNIGPRDCFAGLADAPQPGRPRRYGREVRERILAETLTRPEGTTHWNTRRLAKRVGVSASTVRRVWAGGRLKPHRTETFKFSRDPQLVAKVTDVVGLYLAPPKQAIVLSVDDKTQIQALDRSQPMLPLTAAVGPGLVQQRVAVRRSDGDDAGHGLARLVDSASVRNSSGRPSPSATWLIYLLMGGR